MADYTMAKLVLVAEETKLELETASFAAPDFVSPALMIGCDDPKNRGISGGILGQCVQRSRQLRSTAVGK